jgi:serine/threonine protein kinase
MTLRRFPWKAPRISDNSYRLFVSPPDPEQERQLEANRRSMTPHTHRDDSKRGTQSEPASRNPTGPNEDKQQTPGTEPASRQSTNSEQGTIKGPMRLLRLLPRETRHIIGRMLELDPRKRATMDEVLADPWVQNALVCRQEDAGTVFRAPGHSHALQPGGGGDK